MNIFYDEFLNDKKEKILEYEKQECAKAKNFFLQIKSELSENIINNLYYLDDKIVIKDFSFKVSLEIPKFNNNKLQKIISCYLQCNKFIFYNVYIHYKTNYIEISDIYIRSKYFTKYLLLNLIMIIRFL